MSQTFTALGLTVFSCLGGDSVHVTEVNRRNIRLTLSPVVSISLTNLKHRQRQNKYERSNRTAHAHGISKHDSREIRDVSMAVLLETTLGDIVIDLFADERPKCKKNQVIFLRKGS